MNFEEFLQPKQEQVSVKSTVETVSEEPEELDIQKVVVEELAADKAQQDEEIKHLKVRISELECELSVKNGELEALKAGEVVQLKSELDAAKVAISSLKVEYDKVKAELDAERTKEIDLQERNPNALALLDRDVDLPDRFPGETRDQVLEVVREARDKAEKEGRIRRAQVLEGVLVANEPNGNLAKKRAALEKFFNDNGNILSGEVIEQLERCGISHKKGDEYLLPSEILLRTY